MAGTKISFMRDILKEEKLALKQNEVVHMEIPNYQEISVKNLYADAISDQELAKYLPSKEQLSGKLPERDFFFGILCTLRRQYMLDIIEDAQKKRFKLTDDDKEKKAIIISENWMKELMKHPYHSSNFDA
jgi:hypothetical protein